MFGDYRGKVCIVTGASAGIGAAFARALATRGAHLALIARHRDKLNTLADSLPGNSKGHHLVISGDVTLAADREELVQQTLAKWGCIDVFVNNAGRMNTHPLDAYRFHEIDPEEVDALIALNLAAPLNLIRRVVPVMQKPGLLINISSPAGDICIPGVALYSATKAGITALGQALYRELKPQGIHVLTVKPGYTASDMEYTLHQIDNFKKFHLKPASPDKVAEKSLKAALRGKQSITTDPILLPFLWISHNFPRLIDGLVKRIF